MRIKHCAAILLVLLMLAGCDTLDNDVLNNNTPSREPQSISQAPQDTTPAPTPTPSPAFQPYIHVYEVIGAKDGGEPVQIPISNELLGKINEALKPENEVDVELDVDIWRTEGNYTDATYSWIGVDAVLDPEKSSDNREWALLVNSKNEGVLCDYWGGTDNKRVYEATNLCREIIALASEALVETKYGKTLDLPL